MNDEIGQAEQPGERRFPFEDGCAQLHHHGLTAALLTLSGAAWDGKARLYYAPDPVTASFRQVRELPEMRTVRIEQAGSHMGQVMFPVSKKAGWDHDGKHYEPGELAPMNKVHDHLRGAYDYWRDGMVTRSTRWTYDDFDFWRREYLRQGGLINATKVALGHRNALLDRDHAEYGVGSRKPMAVGGNRG